MPGGKKKTPKKKKPAAASPAPAPAAPKKVTKVKADAELTLSSDEKTPSNSRSDGSDSASERDEGTGSDNPAHNKKNKERIKEKKKKDKDPEEEEEIDPNDPIDTWSGWEENYLAEVDEDKQEEFFMGRRRYMEKSGEAALISASTAERNLKSFFDANKKDKNFQDGALVGALFFYQGAPAINIVQKALHDIGLKGQITPLNRTPGETKNYEVRVWNKGMVESVHATIGKRGAEITKTVEKPFRWKDLRFIDAVVIKVTGLPFQWTESDVRKGLFEVGGFPTAGLMKIIRILFQGKDSGEVSLIYKFLPERFIGWGRIPKNDFDCSRNKKAHWRILRPPREFEEFLECKHCMWTHGTRAPCEVKITVDKAGWEAAEQLANMSISAGKAGEKDRGSDENNPVLEGPLLGRGFSGSTRRKRERRPRPGRRCSMERERGI
jgi:hypothetical protein